MIQDLLVDCNVEDFASDEHTDVPADDADKYLVAEEVVWPVFISIFAREMEGDNALILLAVDVGRDN